MGTWSAEPFGNDTAADWAYDIDGASDWSVVSEALRVAADASVTGLDADDAAVAIAAAEVVARGLGRAANPVVSEDVDAFVERAPRPPAEVVSLAVAALGTATSAQGELAELWEDDPDWLAENERLRTALTTD